MTEIQFGVNLRAVTSRQDLREWAGRADELGYDVLAAPDHLGGVAPFTVLAAAAMVSTRLRLRSYVLNVGFWNPALLAREVATLDALSDGRVELGLGAGHMKAEHDDAGLPWLPFEQRVRALEDTLIEVRRRLADESHQPQPVQRPVPVMVAAMSRQALTVAARHAELIGFAGLRQVKGAPLGTLTICSAAELTERVELVREQADGRPYRSDILLQAVVIGPDPERAAAEWAAKLLGVTVAQVLDTPFALFAEDAERAADELRRRQKAFGLDSISTHRPNMEALGEVIAGYRG
ncbi:MAG TPA: TIGR03621 family F420-dependent LLM class oxidoreductase [Pseudonocardiaceae bacterium]|jgi:probable F420-dependent oxidoreductase|nr:TIGR03621 family F420-dependent LLM class oxidoreductase [Pseudonocardiaceae bacterium]